MTEALGQLLTPIVGAWVAAGLTLFIFSFLYKDNPFFRLGEHMYVGVSVGYSMALLIFKSAKPKLYDALIKAAALGDVWGIVVVLVPAVMGVLLLCRLHPKYAWLSRWSFAFLMGYGAGVTIPASIHSLLLAHMKATTVPLLSLTTVNGKEAVDLSTSALWGDVSHLLVVVGVLSVLVYFFFSVEHRGPFRWISRLGVLFLMVYFGASYGATVMGRFSLLYGRILDLYTYRTGDYHYATFVLLGLMGAVLAALSFLERRKKGRGS